MVLNKLRNFFSTMSIENDCSGKRTSTDLDMKVHVDKVTFLTDKSLPLYSQGEPVRVKVDYTAKCALDNMAFRIALQTPDKTRVCLSTTKPCIHVNEGHNEISLSFNADWLAPGKYSCFVVAYSVNEFGTDQVHDRVIDACMFQKIFGTDEINQLSWNHSAWGYIMMPDIDIL